MAVLLAITGDKDNEPFRRGRCKVRLLSQIPKPYFMSFEMSKEFVGEFVHYFLHWYFVV